MEWGLLWNRCDLSVQSQISQSCVFKIKWLRSFQKGALEVFMSIRRPFGFALTHSPINSPELTLQPSSHHPWSSEPLRAQICSDHVHNTGLSTADRTGSPVFHTLWSYVLGLFVEREYILGEVTSGSFYRDVDANVKKKKYNAESTSSQIMSESIVFINQNN